MERVGFGPKRVRYCQSGDEAKWWENADLPMMSAAERYGELVAYLEAETTYLREA